MGKKLAVIVFLLAFFLFAGRVTVSACSGPSGGPCTGSCNLGQYCEVTSSGYCGCVNAPSCSTRSDAQCTSSAQCPSCGSSSGLCNLTTCQCGCNTDSGSSCCGTWSNWSPCVGGWQQRECQSPSNCNDTQQRSCTSVPTSTPSSGGGPTNTPPPGATNTPTPTATLTPTPTPFIRVRVYDPSLNLLTFPNNICKVNCATSPCTFPECVSNVHTNEFALAQADRGGGINLGSQYVLLGVTPVQNGTVSNTGILSSDCRGATGTRACYYWSTGLTTGSRIVRFVVATVTPTPTATPTPTPGPWVKLRDSSYVSVRSISNNIPVSPFMYDGDLCNFTRYPAPAMPAPVIYYQAQYTCNFSWIVV